MSMQYQFSVRGAYEPVSFDVVDAFVAKFTESEFKPGWCSETMHDVVYVFASLQDDPNSDVLWAGVSLERWIASSTRKLALECPCEACGPFVKLVDAMLSIWNFITFPEYMN